jgi:hypothetical protein
MSKTKMWLWHNETVVMHHTVYPENFRCIIEPPTQI